MIDEPRGRGRDVIVVGGGQAGLAIGYHLAERARDFLILDAGREIGTVWRSRWDSLRLFTSGRFDGLPRMAFPGDPDAYPTKDEVVDYLQAYARAFELPVRLDTRVTGLRRSDDRYVVEAGDERLEARQVVVATGPFQEPAVPTVAEGAGDAIVQVHSAEYRNPTQLPAGPTLVVGGANSGCQIAEELAATRPVELAVGSRSPVLPQRILGKDLWWWGTRLGVSRISVESRLGRRLRRRDPIIGVGPKRLARRLPIALRPRMTGVSGEVVTFADGTTARPAAIVWATGFRHDLSWIDVPGVLDGAGRPIHRRGVTAAPGLYFLGLTWQWTRGSALLGFIHEDAAFIADRIADRTGSGAGQAKRRST